MTTGKHKGEYQVRIQPINKITGKRESWPVDYASNRSTAKALERQMWADYEDGMQLCDGNAIFADEFQKYVNQRKNAISPVTYRDWQNSATEFKKYFKNTKIKDVTERLEEINPTLAKEVKMVLEKNKSERHIRGGMATKMKYENEKKM